MIRWLWDRTLAFNRHPAYPVGLILDFGSFNGLATITGRRWSNKKHVWIYEVDEMGDLPEHHVTRLLNESGYLGAV